MPPEDRHSGLPGGGGGANVKSGETAWIADDASLTVTFGTPFTTTPHVVVALASGTNAVDIPHAFSISTTGFVVEIFKGHGGGGHSWIVHWIATDAGNG